MPGRVVSIRDKPTPRWPRLSVGNTLIAEREKGGGVTAQFISPAYTSSPSQSNLQSRPGSIPTAPSQTVAAIPATEKQKKSGGSGQFPPVFLEHPIVVCSTTAVPVRTFR